MPACSEIEALRSGEKAGEEGSARDSPEATSLFKVTMGLLLAVRELRRADQMAEVVEAVVHMMPAVFSGYWGYRIADTSRPLMADNMLSRVVVEMRQTLPNMWPGSWSSWR